MKAMATAVRARPTLIKRTPPRIVGLGLGRVRHGSCAATGDLKKTPLYDYHVANGGKMVPFAGYHMPVQYSDQSLSESHRFTRSHASVFDVSHMVQHIFKGPNAAAFLERVTPSSWATQGSMQSQLSAFLWPETGGIVDDTVITRIGEDEYFVVTNGACLDKDSKYIDEQLGRFGGGGVEWTRLDDSGLFALQGPRAAEVLAQVLDEDSKVDLGTLYFGKAAWARLKLADGSRTHPLLVSRGGYTGEDGFEISLNGRQQHDRGVRETTVSAVEAIMKAGGPERVRMAGLGARDSLRLEAGMCLYGHDLDDSVTPVEAGLSWIVPKERRTAEAGFHGAEVLARQMTPRSKGGTGVERRRVGIMAEGPPAREGAVVEKDGEAVGVVTSGVPSPTLGRNIAMGYIRDGLHKAGTEVEVVVRGRKSKGVVCKMPFIQTRYWKGEV